MDRTAAYRRIALGIAGLCTTLTLGVSVVKAFTGPGSAGGVGNGAIASDASNNIAVGNANTTANTKLAVTTANTGTTGYGFQVLQPGGASIFYVRNDGAVSIPGALTAGSFSSTVTAGNISAGTFGANTGGGNFSFPGNVTLDRISTGQSAILLDTSSANPSLTLKASAPNGYYPTLSFYSQTSSNQGSIVGYGGLLYDTPSQHWFRINGATMLLVNANGVGVGGATPSTYKLDVSGSIRSSSGGFVFPDGTTQTTAYAGGSATTTAGNVSAGAFGSNTGGGNYSFPATLSVANGITLSGTPTGSSDVNYIQANNSASTVGLLAGSGVFSASSGPYFGARGNTYSAIGGQRGQMFFSGGAVSSPTGNEGNITFATTPGAGTGEATRLIIHRNGNVGVGIDPTSTYKLDVAGAVRSTSGGFVFPDGTTQTTAYAGGTQTSNAGNISAGTFGANTGGGNYAFPANVNIAGSYQISGTTRITTNATYTWLVDPSGSGYNILLGNTTDPSNYYDNTTHYFRNRGGTVNYAALNATGLGIGNSNPTYKLDVAGYIRSSSGGYIFPDGTTQTTAYAGGSQTTTAGNVSAGTFGANTGGGNYTFPANVTLGTGGGILYGRAMALQYSDIRTLTPSNGDATTLKFGFGSFNNSGGGPYADWLLMRSYTDSSGGNDNVLMLNKSGIGARIYQQTFGSSSAFSAYKDIVIADNGTSAGYLTKVSANAPNLAVANSLVYDNGSSVGISNTSPSYKLDVAGAIRSSSGGFVFPDGTTQTTAYAGGSQTTSAGNVSAGTFGANTGGGNYAFPANLSAAGGNFVISTNDQASGAWIRTNGDGSLVISNKGGGNYYGYGGSTSLIHRFGVSGSGVTFDNNAPSNSLTVNSAGTVGIAGGNMTIDSSGNVVTNGTLTMNTIGKGIVGQYDPTKNQAVWAMGSSYQLPTNGVGGGSLYGLAWSYNPDYGGAGNNAQSKPGLNHQLLLMMNGTTYTAIGAGIWSNGVIQSASGGFKFPDGTTQTTAASASATLTAGNVSAGTFGVNTGGGNYKFPGTIILSDDSYISASGGYTSFLTSTNAAQPVKVSKIFVGANYSGSALAPVHIVSANSAGTNDLLMSYDASGNYRNGISNNYDGGSAGGNKMNFLISNSSVSGQTNVMTLTGNGYAGIGTTAPTTRLHLSGSNVAYRGQLSLEASDFAQVTFYSGPTTNTNEKGSIYYSMSDNKFNILNYNGGAGGNIILNNPGDATPGNVGIATNSPSYRLDVAGAIRSSTGGFVFPDGTTQTTAAAGASTMTAGNVSAGTFGSNTGGGNYSFPSTLQVGSSAQASTGSGVLTIGNVSANFNPTGSNWNAGGTTLVVSGLDYSSIGFHDAGSRVDFIRAGAGTIQLGYDGGFGAAQTQFMGNALFPGSGTWNTSGNVGIGTTSPTAKLQVASGDSSVILIGPNATYGSYLALGSVGSGNITASGKAQVVSSNGNLHLDAGTGQNIYVGYFTTSNTLINANGGNVGIGTTGPGYKLDVAGAIRSSSGGFVFPDGTTQTTAAAGASTMSAGNVSSGQFGANTGGGIFTFPSSIGVGTASVSNSEGWDKVIDMVGSSHARESIRTVAGIDLRLLAHDSGWKGSPAGGVIGTESNHPLSFQTNAANRMTILANGSVGIGTVSPSGLLQLGSSSYQADSALRIGAGNGSSYKVYSIGVPFSSTDTTGRYYDFIIRDESTGTDKLNIDWSTGNVGIGNSAPGYKLDVAGAIRSASGGFVFPDGTTQTTAATGGGASTLSAANVSAGTFGANTGGGAYTFSGTLNVNGGLQALGANFELRDGGASDSTAVRVISSGGNLYLQNGSGDHTYFRNKTAGNIMDLNNNGNLTLTGGMTLNSNESGGPQIRFGNAGLYGIGNTSAGYTDVFYHSSGSGIRFGQYNGSTFSTQATMNASGLTVNANISVAGTTLIGTHPTYGSGYSAFWRSGVDYSLLTDGTNTFLNAPSTGGTLYFRRGNSDMMTLSGSTLTVGGGSGKINVGTVDPIYIINGEKFATYLPSMVGVKEEVAGDLDIPCVDGRCEKVIDFANEPKGSDLWLFAKATDIKKHLPDASILLTPAFEGRTSYRKGDGTLTIIALPYEKTDVVEVSYRFTAPRFDAEKWLNTSTDEADGFIIND